MKGKHKGPKYSAPKNETDIKADLDQAVKENETAFADMQAVCNEYNSVLEAGQLLLEDVADLVNSIASHPKKFDEQIEKIRAIKIEHLTIEQYKTEERKAFIEGGALAAVVAVVGAAFARAGKVSKKGIIGAVIALFGIIFGGLLTAGKKRKTKKQAIAAINKLYTDTYALKENHAKVQTAISRLIPTAKELKNLLAECEKYRGQNKLSFLPMSEDRKKLSQLVTNAASFAKLLSQKV